MCEVKIVPFSNGAKKRMFVNAMNQLKFWFDQMASKKDAKQTNEKLKRTALNKKVNKTDSQNNTEKKEREKNIVHWTLQIETDGFSVFLCGKTFHVIKPKMDASHAQKFDIKFMILVNFSFAVSEAFCSRSSMIFFHIVLMMKMCQRHLQYVTNPSKHVRESTHRNKSAKKKKLMTKSLKTRALVLLNE